MKVNILHLLKSAYPLLTFKQKMGILFFSIIAFLGSFVEVISISSVLVFADNIQYYLIIIGHLKILSKTKL